MFRKYTVSAECDIIVKEVHVTTTVSDECDIIVQEVHSFSWMWILTWNWNMGSPTRWEICRCSFSFLSLLNISIHHFYPKSNNSKQQWVFRLKNMDILYLTRTQGKVYELWLVELDKFCPQKNVKVYYFWKCSKLKRKIREKGWNYLKWGLSEICKAKIVDRLLGKRLKRPKSLEYLWFVYYTVYSRWEFHKESLHSCIYPRSGFCHNQL